MHVIMAWRNIWRNSRRTLLTLSAIAFACMLLVFMLSFQFGSYDVMINTAVRIHTGHLQVQAQDYQEKTDIRLVVNDYKEVGKVLSGIPRGCRFYLSDECFFPGFFSGSHLRGDGNRYRL